MDGYITKPIKKDKLDGVIQTIMDAVSGIDKKNELLLDTEKESDINDVNIFDKAEALALVDGEEDLLRDIVDLFFDNCPKWMEELKESVEHGDAFQIESLAHKIKGSLRNLAAGLAGKKAQDLENIGNSKDLIDARDVYDKLDEEITSLCSVLESFRQEKNPEDKKVGGNGEK